MMKSKILFMVLAFLLSFSLPLLARGTAPEEAEPAPATEGPKVPETKYSEAPMLAELVARGELPNVDQRLPDEPVVIEPLEMVGKYGGTLRVIALDNNPWGDLQESPERGNFLLQMTMDGDIVPDLASDFTLAGDATYATVTLRKGLKWSDGVPVTADDVLFMFNDMHYNDKISTWGLRGYMTSVKKLDDYRVILNFDGPHPEASIFPVAWYGSEWAFIHPKHYLQKWHADYNSNADKLAKDEGYADWVEAFTDKFWYAPLKNAEKPTTQPWMPSQLTTTNKVFVRNPYYHVVDTAGNQLPYIDEVFTEIVADLEVYNLKIISGEADVAYSNTNVTNFTLFKENEDAGGYRVETLPGIMGAEVAYYLNQTTPDPYMAELFGNPKFRQALSLAINREEINKVAYFGLAVPRAATVVPNVSFYDAAWGEAHPFAGYAPEEAMRLLDEIGLTAKDRDGFRVKPDGKPIILIIESSTSGEGATQSQANELVKEYWEDVGLRVEIKWLEPAFYNERARGGMYDIRSAGTSNSAELRNYVSLGSAWSPLIWTAGWAARWYTWLDAKAQVDRGTASLDDYEGGKLPGVEPPQKIKDFADLWSRRNASVFLSEEYKQLSRQIYQFHADELYIIGTVGLAPVLYIAKDNIGNVPDRLPPNAEASLNLSAFTNQLFYK